MQTLKKNLPPQDNLRLIDNSYAETLRVLGLEAAKFSPKFVEIERIGNQFQVHGTSATQTEHGSTSRLQQLLGGLLSSLRFSKADKIGSDEAAATFNFIYGVDDLTKLNRNLSLGREWRVERKLDGKAADIYSLSELLRVIGEDLDAHEAHLLKLTKEGHSVTAVLKDREGATITRDYSVFSLHKRQQEMLADRSKPIFDPWKDAK